MAGTDSSTPGDKSAGTGIGPDGRRSLGGGPGGGVSTNEQKDQAIQNVGNPNRMKTCEGRHPSAFSTKRHSGRFYD